MNSSAYNSSLTNVGGGRAILLFLLFALALYMFFHAGFSMFAIVCLIPVIVIITIITLKKPLFIFWTLTCINYLVQWKNFPSTGIPMSMYNEGMELLLLALAIINIKEIKSERILNLMFLALTVWCTFCTLELLNDSCNLGIQFGAWYTGARAMAFQLMYAFLVFSLYISNPNVLVKYLMLWAALSLFAAFWVWKQQQFGFTDEESIFINGRGRSTHIINAGTTIRYFSVMSDAANFGVNMAATAVAFIIFAITSKIKKYRIVFLITGLACLWATFPSGTRTATFCFFAGIATYVVLSKSFKIAIPVAIVFALAYFILAFTTIGNSNASVRRMRSGFNKNDASMGARADNQKVMKKHLAEAPWGIGIGMGMDNVPANNKWRRMATIPPDSEYMFIWIRTGRIGMTLFIITTALMFCGACWIVLFKLKSKSLRGIGAGFCCAFVSLQLGGYANQVLMQFPNCLLFYGGLSMVYGLPLYEKEWIEHEEKLLAAQAEKKRMKEEKRKNSRVKTWLTWK
ncbi:MAG: O-antigen ligase family protein [Prevotella sp.]|nr:O-antigen ligase family protein [Prevotella sp.]